jgi:hypothetical protein
MSLIFFMNMDHGLWADDVEDEGWGLSNGSF